MNIAPITDENAPWKQRFRLSLSRGYLARCNYERGLVVSNKSGIYQLYSWNVSNGELRQLTQHTTGKEKGMISSDGQSIYYLNDTQGDEIGHLICINTETDEQIDITPDMKPYSIITMKTDYISKTLAYLISDKENGFQLFTRSMISTTFGPPNLIYQTSNFTENFAISYDGQLVVIETRDTEKGAGSNLVVFDTRNPKKHIGTLDDGMDVNIVPKQFASLSNDTRLLAKSNRSGIYRPFIWNVSTNERIDFASEQLGNEGDVTPLDWSSDGKLILLLHIHNATFQVYSYCIDDGILNKLTEQPSGVIFDAQFSPNGSIIVQWETSNMPLQTISLNGKTGAFEQIMLKSLINDQIPPSHLRRSVTFPSSDGQLIQGWLTLPVTNDNNGPLPTILDMHGGPEDVSPNRFGPQTEVWVDHGFAHLSINYRGSITFGRTFQHKIYSNIGYWEIEDVVAARTWLIEQGIAQANVIFLTGWSYGGYLTLLALGKHPNLWAGGMAGIAVVDWTIQYEDSAERLRGYQKTLFGGTPEEKPELYITASPITYVEQIIAPVLIIQACNDTRCPIRPMKNYEAKMHQYNKNCEIEWFDGGHSLNNVEQTISHIERMLQWVQRVLNTNKT
ncbi:unnamed protein product [Adineta steineri]|uniref:Peptidase S9 prolyl oligopeptidase catalytic domain-containing protein n=1 Tax=Adineta steineri TaxID=433720 RepID=A0A814AZ83_9BILA|nr:unnamed protein product [Adineta steineri]CAF0919373.1 unnamed protein product [Adineta steineri]